MRRDELYLREIVTACRRIDEFAGALSEEAFVHVEIVKSAVIRELTVIGEAASRISQEVRERHAEVPWSDAVRQRNFVVHRYFATDWSAVFATITDDVPSLHDDVVDVLATDFSITLPKWSESGGGSTIAP